MRACSAAWHMPSYRFEINPGTEIYALRSRKHGTAQPRQTDSQADTPSQADTEACTAHTHSAQQSRAWIMHGSPQLIQLHALLVHCTSTACAPLETGAQLSACVCLSHCGCGVVWFWMCACVCARDVVLEKFIYLDALNVMRSDMLCVCRYDADEK